MSLSFLVFADITPHDMMARHKEICESLEIYLEDANPEHSYSMQVLYDL